MTEIHISIYQFSCNDTEHWCALGSSKILLFYCPLSSNLGFVFVQLPPYSHTNRQLSYLCFLLQLLLLLMPHLSTLDPCFYSPHSYLYSELLPILPPRSAEAIDMRDISSDALLMFQHRHHTLLRAVLAWGLPCLLPWLLWSEPLITILCLRSHFLHTFLTASPTSGACSTR